MWTTVMHACVLAVGHTWEKGCSRGHATHAGIKNLLSRGCLLDYETYFLTSATLQKLEASTTEGILCTTRMLAPSPWCQPCSTHTDRAWGLYTPHH
jgi:hypothetical protein